MKKLGETLLISEELLKLYSPISKNVGVDKVFPFVHLAQPYYITPILGMPLTQQLQDEIDNDNLSEENKALIIKIAMPLAMWTSYLAVRGLGYTMSEKGLTKEHSENSESLNSTEMGQYILSLKNQAEMAQELLIRYLCKCRELYPLWMPSNECNCSQYEEGSGSAQKTYKNLMYFPSSRKKGCGCGTECSPRQYTDLDVEETTLTIDELTTTVCKQPRSKFTVDDEYLDITEKRF